MLPAYLCRLRRVLLILGCATLLIISSASAASSRVTHLIERLEKGDDFRVRVQAALELGKSKSNAARAPLEVALDDGNAAVRAAAAAALKVLGDPAAIPALERHKKDTSPAVRSQIKSSIAALKSAASSISDKPRILVKLGRMKDARGVRSGLLGEVEQASRKKFGELPGIRVVAAEPDSDGKSLPLVMVTGQVRKLNTSSQGDSVVYSASVEYMVHRMPEQAIAGTVSGSASTTASRAEARDRRRNIELKRAVLAAAVESAVRRAPEALAAAAR
ncbi:MAG: HEAT repeat domain-containing protein [Polyangiaceae bacterium]